MRNSSLFKYSILPAFCLMSLVGCKSLVSSPSHVMPSGYTYHQQDYKSPPPAKADDLGYEYSAEKNAAILEMWRPAAEDLVSRLEIEAGLSNADIYLRVPLNTDTQMATFDYVLRDVLRERGHTIISSRYAGTILTYNLINPETLSDDDQARYSYNDTLDQQDPTYIQDAEIAPMIIEMVAYDKTTPIASLNGVYDVPMYGYDKFDLPHFWAPIAGQKSVGVYDEREKQFNE